MPGISLFGPSATLPPPQVGVTSAPDAQSALNQFLAALKNNDFAGMYSMLASDTQAALTQDDFTKKYNDALDTMGAASIDYQVTSQLLSPNEAQVGFRLVYHTALAGDLQRDLVAHLALGARALARAVGCRA